MMAQVIRFAERALEPLPRWVTPNGVTVFRGLLLAPVTLLLNGGMPLAALAVSVVAFALDFVDGTLARMRGLTSEAGAFLDPLVDKVLVCGLLWCLHDGSAFRLAVNALVTALAVALTVARVRKWLTPWKPGTMKANGAGKLKMTFETAGVLLLVAARTADGTLASGMASCGTLLLAMSVPMAFRSLQGQLTPRSD